VTLFCYSGFRLEFVATFKAIGLVVVMVLLK